MYETSFEGNFPVYHTKMGFVKDYIGWAGDEHRIVMLSAIRNSSSLLIGSIISLELFCCVKKRSVNFGTYQNQQSSCCQYLTSNILKTTDI